MDKRTFLDELARLERSAHERGNPGSYQSDDCDNSSHCMFCAGCKDCHRCNYAVDCSGCTRCTHVRDCVACHHSTHLEGCERCVECQYLVRCRDCAECLYCFGCVGLVRKEFHILNQPYDRKTYFQKVKQLRLELGLR